MDNNYNTQVGDYVMEGVFDDPAILDEIDSYTYVPQNWGKYERLRKFFVMRNKVSLRDKSYFFHMLAVMVGAGIPVVNALRALSERSDNEKFKFILKDIVKDVEAGMPFSTTMAKFDDVFDEADIGIVKSGEQTGTLDILLFKLSGQLDKKYDLNMKLWGAATYPLVVLSVLIVVTVGMLTWVFPNLIQLLEDGGVSRDSLPFFTQLILSAQGFVVGYWWLILVVFFAIYGGFKYYVSTNYGAIRWDLFKLKIPFAGNLLRKVFTFRFVSLLGLLVESNLPIIKALKISGESLSNRVYKLKIQEVINGVRAGKSISEGVSHSEFLFPSEVSKMFYVGESSGNLAKVSEKIADQYQEEVDNALRTVASVFEPILILIVGIFVAVLALAVMSPIFALGNVVGS